MSILSRIAQIPKAWLAAAFMVALVVLLVGLGWWQGTAVGPQVQAPMFYDDHYVYPRPWTQAQEAPGVPVPAPVSALYGPNRVSQSFVAGMDHLAMVRVWLAGPANMPVQIGLAGNGRIYSTEIRLDGRGRYYDLDFPPIAGSNGQSFTLALYAPQASESQPVSTRSVGGDRLDGIFLLNEYPRPGNLELYTYSRGFPGRWWLQAAGQQLLPDVFALRVQQYKPAPFKGVTFPVLIGLTMVLSGAFLVLSRPRTMKLNAAVGWGLAVLLLAFLGWQLIDQRLRLPLVTDQVSLAPQANAISLAPGAEDPQRLVYDFPSLLWTAEREPEARLVETQWEPSRAEGVIQVPAESALDYNIVIPLNGRFHAAVQALDRPLQFSVRLGEETLYSQEIPVSDEATPLELDLSPWGGQVQTLSLLTKPPGDDSETAHGIWLSPQLSATADWLLTALPEHEEVEAVNYRLQPQAAAGLVELAGYQVKFGPEEDLLLTLYWRVLETGGPYATIFIHLLDESGQIVAQRDSQPVSGTYPIPAWQPGPVMADRHRLPLPEQGSARSYSLALGLYDPDTLVRWTATDETGEAVPDNRILLPIPPLGEASP